jgi:hypothetical protein
MTGLGRTAVTVIGAVLVAATVAAQNKPTSSRSPAPQHPNDEGARPKLIAPIRGEAVLEHTRPVTRREGNMVVTTIKVRNANNAPIAGLKVDEFWYDKKGEPVTGAQPFRYRKPLMPGETIEVVLRVPAHPQMDRNSYKFEHANGTIKPKLVPKL